MARAFDHALHVMLPGDLGQFAEGFQLAELRGIVGIGDRSRTQAVAQREADVVGLHDFADFLEVGVEEILLVMRQAPLGHDRAAAADDAGHALGSQRHIAQQDAGMDGEVVHALLGLFDQGVAEQLPGQVFGNTVDLFQRLVDRHGADRHRRVADDPLARLVDVLAGGQVHHGVRTPADAPGQLGHFFLDGGAQRRVTDVAVDLHQEVAADDHRLQLGVVDVRRDDGAAARDFRADEFGGDFLGNGRAEALPGMLLDQQAGLTRLGELHVLADGDVLHLRRDDALLCIVHLADVVPGLGPARVTHMGEAHGGKFGIVEATLAEFGGQPRQLLGVAAVLDPGTAHVGQALAHVDGDVRVGVGAGSVVDGNRGVDLATEVGGRHVQADLAHGYADVRARTLYIDLLRTREGLNGLLVDLGGLTQILVALHAHRLLLGNVGANLSNTADQGRRAPQLRWRDSSRSRRGHLVPYAGLNLIRFNGIRNFPISAFASRHPDKNAVESNQDLGRTPWQWRN